MIFPFTIIKTLKGKNATNWPGLVVLSTTARQPAAVWAQEAWESLWKCNPINMVKRIVSKDARRDMEIMGHEVEVQAAVVHYGDKAGPRRAAEAASMKRGYNGLFDRMTQAELVKAMERQATKAAKWVARHDKQIRRFL